MKQIIKRVSVLLMLTILAGAVTGCSSMVSKQSDAVKNVLATYTEPSENGFRIWYDDLKKEIKSQQEAQKLDKDAAEASYEIPIHVPNVEKIDFSALTYSIPEYDIEKPDSKEFAKAYKISFLGAFVEYVKSKEDVPTTDIKISVSLKKDEGNWVASLDDDKMKELAAAQQEALQLKLDNILEQSEDFKKIKIAENLSTYLLSALPNKEYMDHIKLMNIEPLETDDYKITINYPNPVAVYKAAGAAYFDSSDIIYGKKNQKFITKQLNTYLNLGFKENIELVTSSFTIKDGEAGIDIEDIKASMVSAKKNAAKEVMAQINEKAIPAKKRPVTGILKGSSNGRTIKIEIPKNEGNFYLKFYKVSNSKSKEEGKLVMTVFIRKGDKTTIKLPNGYYKMKESVGNTWYGPKYVFGSAGSYSVAKSVFKIESNYTYTLRLRNKISGNVPTEGIAQDAF